MLLNMDVPLGWLRIKSECAGRRTADRIQRKIFVLLCSYRSTNRRTDQGPIQMKVELGPEEHR
jgi:hypothetical protein